jgi:hypothetical protein
MMTSLDSLFDESLVAAQQPQWPGGKDGEPVKAAVLWSLLESVMISKQRLQMLLQVKHSGYKVEIVQRHLLPQQLIQSAIALRRFCRWQRFCSTTPAFRL